MLSQSFISSIKINLKFTSILIYYFYSTLKQKCCQCTLKFNQILYKWLKKIIFDVQVILRLKKIKQSRFNEFQGCDSPIKAY